MSTIIQTRIKDLLNTYLPTGSEDFDNYYVAVDSSEFTEANKMPLSVLLAAADTKIQHGTGSTTALTHTVTFDESYTDSEYYLNLSVYRKVVNGGDTTRTAVPIKNITKTAAGFSFTGFETGLTFEYLTIE
jgi:hypothetical protein